nr:DUF421 domain-containing protein [Actinomycetales bacterium]
MDAVVRACAVYLGLLLLFRLTGKRTLSQVTTFDFVILLILGEATAQAMLGEDFSVVQAMVVITTLLVISRVFDYLSWKFEWFERMTESVPVVLVDNGKPVAKTLRRYRLAEHDILTAGRENHGIERMDQIKWAVMEVSGGISVIPYAVADS